jgi:Ser/Thr protein kinase RdoA (MazF antagonist)
MLQGYLWGDNGTKESFRSVEDMNCWLNKRLKLVNKAVDLHPYPLVLCHLDLCRRNIKIMEDNAICLLDWGHAGFFPWFFETAALSCVHDDTRYRNALLQALKSVKELKDAEQECVNLLLRARAASLRYIL